MSWCVMIGNESAGQKYALYKFVWNNKLGCVEIWIRRTSSFLRGGVKKDRYLVTWWGSIQVNVTEQVPKMSQVGYHLRDNWDVISSEENSIRNNNCSYQISVQSYLLPIQVKLLMMMSYYRWKPFDSARPRSSGPPSSWYKKWRRLTEIISDFVTQLGRMWERVYHSELL